MLPKAWFAYAFFLWPALSTTLPKVSQSERNLAHSALKLIAPGNVSAATTNATYSSDIPNSNLLLIDSASQQASNESASLYDLPVEYDLPALTDANPVCDGAIYGTDLDRGSCFDAWRYIGLTSPRESWGPRGPNHSFRHRLPYRWSSGRFTTRSQSLGPREYR